MKTENELTGLEIAVVGMVGRFPGAPDLRAFWDNIREGRDSISFFSEEELGQSGVLRTLYSDAQYVPARGVLGDVDRFDAAFFGYSPKEAAMLDPQQRLFLQAAWQALEVAGYDPSRYSRRIGVFASIGFNSYLVLNLQVDPGFIQAEHGPQAMLSNDKDFLATRVSYKLGLSGPSVVVQSACSSSLLAIHQACQSLLSGESDMTLAGGVTVRVPEKTGHFYQEGMINSRDGHCRPFDANATGTVAGNGIGVVVLKRLEDALADGDHVHAVIKGGAVNNDGDRKVGYAAPSAVGQARVIELALGIAGVSPDTIGYVEAHGSGTRMGDPIEVEALRRAFSKRTRRGGYCGIGSVKANIGHCDAAAGVAGFIRAVLAVENGVVPPNANFEAPNPECQIEGSPFFVPTSATPWAELGAPRRAGVSSFGMGGTNVHLVLEQAPERPRSGESRPWQLLCVSARTTRAHARAKDELRAALRQGSDLPLADIAYSMHMGRKRFEHSTAIVARDVQEARDSLSRGHNPHVFNGAWDGVARGCVFMFSGQGAQFAGMARELYDREASFRADIEECQELLAPHMDAKLCEVLFERGDAAEQRLAQTRYTQPALFATEYALARLLMRLGVTPEVLIGHSVGEYVAATLGSVFTLRDAAKLVANRGRLIQKLSPGAMILVSATPGDVERFLGEGVALAAVNAPDATVLSGDSERIAQVCAALEEGKVAFTRLRTSHAFHSAMMDPVLVEFEQLVGSVRASAPAIPIVSNVTGDYLTEAEALDPRYWAKHLRHTVWFARGIERIANGAPKTFIEVGPGRGLDRFARQVLGRESPHRVQHVLPRPRPEGIDDAQFEFISAIGRLWVGGIQPSWEMLYEKQVRHRVPTPPYPFHGESYWADVSRAAGAVQEDTAAAGVWGPSWRRWAGPSRPAELGQRGAPVFWMQPSHGAPVRQRIQGVLGSAVFVSPGTSRKASAESVTLPFGSLDAWSEFWARTAERHGVESSVDVVWVAPRREPADVGAVTDFVVFLEGVLAHLGERAAKVHLTVALPGVFDTFGVGGQARRRIALLEPLVRAAAALRPGLAYQIVDVGDGSREKSAALGATRESALEMLARDALRPEPGRVLAYRQGRRFLRKLDRLDEARPATEMPDVVVVLGELGDCVEKLIIGWHERYGGRFVLVEDPRLDRAGSRSPHPGLLADASVPVERVLTLSDARSKMDGSRRSALWFFLPAGELSDPSGIVAATAEAFAAVDALAARAVSDLRELDLEQIVWFSETSTFFGHPGGWSGSVLDNAMAVALGASAHRRVSWDPASLGGSSSVTAGELASLVASALEGASTGETVWVGGVHPDAAVWRKHSVASTGALEAVEQKAKYARPDLASAYAAPVTDRQKIVCGVWQALFEVDRVGIHDNFFELGGDSIMALKLLSALETQFRVALPLAEVFNSPTVATQANAVREFAETPMSERKLSPLVALQRNGAPPPFFCVHPAGGIVHCYIEMSRSLGPNQPFYAFQHPGIDGKSGPYTTYEKMAEFYVGAMKERQPRGPYYLGGWSFGGTVAFEMACKLRAAGDEVGMLALFDTPGPSALYNVASRPDFEFAGMMTFLSQALSSMFGAEIDVPVEELRRVPREQQLDYLIARAVRATGSADLGESKEALERIIDIFELTDRGEQRYKPSRYPGRVHMYRVQDMADYEFTAYKNHPQISSASFGWDALCEELLVRFVPGTHMSMIFPPNVEVLCERFGSDLADCIGQLGLRKAV